MPHGSYDKLIGTSCHWPMKPRPFVPVLEDILIDFIEPVMVLLNHNLLGSSLVNDQTVVVVDYPF